MLNDATPILGIVGATGRLGSAIADECSSRGIQIGLLASRNGWNITSVPHIIIDASAPEALDDTAEYCLKTGAALIYAVSVVPREAYDKLVKLSSTVHVVIADNLSLGHWLQISLIRATAALTVRFYEEPRMSVFERHPTTKIDRPSASAKSLANTWANLTPTEPHSEILYQRAGRPVSDHIVTFDLRGASVTIGHNVTNLQAATQGLLSAIDYIVSQPRGLSTIFDIYSHIYGGVDYSLKVRSHGG